MCRPPPPPLLTYTSFLFLSVLVSPVPCYPFLIVASSSVTGLAWASSQVSTVRSAKARRSLPSLPDDLTLKFERTLLPLAMSEFALADW